MNRFPLARLLNDSLGGDFVVVASPDHPELVSGPDLFVGGRGRLTAVFRVARSTPIPLLQARVVAARLALPAPTTFVGMFEEDARVAPEFFAQAFDHAIGGDDARGLRRLCMTESDNPQKVRELQRIQHQHAAFYSALLRVSDQRQRVERPATSVKEVVSALWTRHPIAEEPWQQMVGRRIDEPLSQPRHDRVRRSTLLRLRATVRETDIAALPRAERQMLTRQFRPLWCESLDADFIFDGGVPYQRAFKPRILLVDEWPTHRFDPRKPERAAAFSGWLLAVPTGPDDVEDLIDRSRKVIARQFHE